MMENFDDLVSFFIEIEELKKIVRYSPCPEHIRDSSADHSWKLAFMAFILGEETEGINSYHAVQLCIVHDLAEAVTGDVDAYLVVTGEVTEKEKYEREEKAMLDFKGRISKIGDKIYDLWKEFEDCQTPEAKYAKALDKIEALIHLLYVDFMPARDDKEAELTAKYADKAVEEFPQLKPFYRIIKSRIKDRFNKKGIEWKPHYN